MSSVAQQGDAAARVPETGTQLVRFLIVGACGYVLAMAIYSGQIAAGISAYAAVPAAFILNGLFNFTLNRLWTFPPSGRPVTSELARFCAVAAGSLVVNYGALYVLHDVVGLAAVPAQALAIIIATPVGFLGNKLWSFGAA
jgi:putative flippase GtrA